MSFSLRWKRMSEAAASGEHVESYVSEHFPGQKVLTIAIEDEYVEHGNVDLLKKKLGIDAASIAERILALQTGNT